MKTLILKMLSLGSSHRVVNVLFNRIALLCIISEFIFLFVKRGLLTALQGLGFSVFIVSLLFVLLTSYLGIQSHQQERVRDNFKLREHQRSILIFILSLAICSLLTELLMANPFLLLFF